MALITIGTQTWNVENLDVDVFGDGTPIMEVSASDQWERCSNNGIPAWCYYNYDSSNSKTYGRLYNWYVVSASVTAHPIVQNPQFKVPTRTDYDVLVTYVGSRTNASPALKNTTNWLTNSRINGNGTNATQWTGNPGGFMKPIGEFWDQGWSGNWWTRISQSAGGYENAWANKMYFGDRAVYELLAPSGMGLSIRLILSGSWTGSSGYKPSENYG